MLPHSPGQSLCIYLIDTLYYLKESGSARDTVCLERRRYRQTYRLLRATAVCHNKIDSQRVQASRYTLRGCIIGFEVYRNIAALSCLLRVCLCLTHIRLCMYRCQCSLCLIRNIYREQSAFDRIIYVYVRLCKRHLALPTAHRLSLTSFPSVSRELEYNTLAASIR